MASERANRGSRSAGLRCRCWRRSVNQWLLQPRSMATKRAARPRRRARQRIARRMNSGQRQDLPRERGQGSEVPRADTSGLCDLRQCWIQGCNWCRSTPVAASSQGIQAVPSAPLDPPTGQGHQPLATPQQRAPQAPATNQGVRHCIGSWPSCVAEPPHHGDFIAGAGQLHHQIGAKRCKAMPLLRRQRHPRLEAHK